MNDKIIPIFFVLLGGYTSIIGWINLTKNKKILSVFELYDLYIIKKSKGLSAYDARKKDLLETKKHKLFSLNYLVLGVIATIVGIYLLLFQ